MKVGDLVQWKLPCGTRSGSVGVLVEKVADCTSAVNRFWVVQFLDGHRDTTREHFMVAINEGG